MATNKTFSDLLNDQLNILITDNLQVSDLKKAKHCLKTIGYHRLSNFCKPFYRNNIFIENISFDKIIETYAFDR